MDPKELDEDNATQDIKDNCEYPDTLTRTCTDVGCTVTFVICFTLFSIIVLYAIAHGKYDRFFDLRDTNGQLCGKGNLTQKPYLVFCMGSLQALPGLGSGGDVISSGMGSGGYSYQNRRCVSRCPDLGAQAIGCGTPYPTKAYYGNLCIPSEEFKLKQWFAMVHRHPSFQVMVIFSDIPRGSWRPILISAAAVAIMAFVYLTLIGTCMKCLSPSEQKQTSNALSNKPQSDKSGRCGQLLIWCALGSLIFILVCGGLYFCIAAATGGADGFPHTGDSKTNWIVGIACLVLGAMSACVLYSKSSNLLTAVTTLKAASECVVDMPVLLFEPFFQLAWKGILFISLLCGLILLLSCGQVNPSTGNFHYQPEEWWFVYYYIFMFFWIISLCNAFSCFTFSYAIQIWFFSDAATKPPNLCCQTCQGSWIALRWHFGTLAFGSMLVALFRPFQVFARFMDEVSKDTANACAACVACCCTRCIDCVVHCMEFVSRNAYMATVINGNGFCDAAKFALAVLKDEMTAVFTVKGATWIFEFAGLGGLTAIGVGATHLQLKCVKQYSDPNSPSFVSDPTPTLIVAGVVCFTVAWPFMVIFGLASDNILFCYAAEKRRKKGPLAGLISEIEADAQGCFPRMWDSAQKPADAYSEMAVPETKPLINQYNQYAQKGDVATQQIVTQPQLGVYR